MILLILMLAFELGPYPTPVPGYPGDVEVYLVWNEVDSGYVIALAIEEGGEAVLITEAAAFPGMFNTAKSFADYDYDRCILSVTSQFPFSANYYLAAYSLTDDDDLILLEGEAHDYYLERFDEIREHLEEDDLEAALENARTIMYPQRNYYGVEMCLLLLGRVHDQVCSDLAEGILPETAMKLFEEYVVISNHLLIAYYRNDENFYTNFFAMVPSREDYPEEADLTLDEYCRILLSYADMLEETGDSTYAEVRTAAENLLEPL